LKELGLKRNTLVIFTSDNGPAKREAPPFRGNKQTNFEGGVRVPTMMSWPDHTNEGTSCDQINGVIDVLPTCAAITGTELNPSRIIDGKDLSPLMFEAKPAPIHDAELYYLSRRFEADGIRMGDWKLLVKYSSRTKKHVSKGPWLYDLKNDIGETTNVVADHLEVVERLIKELKKREAEIIKNQRPVGRVGSSRMTTK